MRRAVNTFSRQVVLYPFIALLFLFLTLPPAPGAAAKKTESSNAAVEGEGDALAKAVDSDGPEAVEFAAAKSAKKKSHKTILIIAGAVLVAGAATYFLVFARKKYGTIDIQSTPPGASVFLDGTDTGKSTPVILEKVKTGQHSLTLKKEGLQDNTVTVTVEKDKTTEVKIELLAAAMTENFNSGNADDWGKNGFGDWQVVSGVYTFTGSGSTGERAYSWYDIGDYSDFTYEASVRGSGDQSIAFRGNTASEEWYAFYAGQKSWAVFYFIPSDIDRFLKDYSDSAALKSYPEWNIFKVVARGSSFTFYINGTLVGTATDTRLARGKIGFYVRNYDGVKFEVDNVSVSLATSAVVVNVKLR